MVKSDCGRKKIKENFYGFQRKIKVIEALKGRFSGKTGGFSRRVVPGSLKMGEGRGDAGRRAFSADIALFRHNRRRAFMRGKHGIKNAASDIKLAAIGFSPKMPIFFDEVNE